MKNLKLAILVAWVPLTASAATDICSAYRNTAPQPDWYNAVCNKSGGFAKLGGAFSTFADAFNLNPASIPTSPTPYGVEYIGSFTPGSPAPMRHNFAFIKGFKRIGAGISTNSDDTFYSNSQLQNFQGTSYDSSYLEAFVPSSIAPTFNLGSAIALLPEKLMKSVSSNLGVAVKYNKVNQKFAPGGGISIETQNFTFGASLVRESETTYSAETTYYTFTAGYRHPYFQLEFVQLKNESSNSLVSDPMQILSGSASYNGLVSTLAFRRLTNYLASETLQFHFAVQYQFTRFLSAAYLINYIPGTHSLGLQVFL